MHTLLLFIVISFSGIVLSIVIAPHLGWGGVVLPILWTFTIPILFLISFFFVRNRQKMSEGVKTEVVPYSLDISGLIIGIVIGIFVWLMHLDFYTKIFGHNPGGDLETLSVFVNIGSFIIYPLIFSWLCRNLARAIYFSNRYQKSRLQDVVLVVTFLLLIFVPVLISQFILRG